MIINEQRHIVTNYHCVQNTTKLQLAFYDKDDWNVYEVEINDKTYTINSNNEILDDESYDIIGKLINNMPYIYLDCCYNITGAIYERNNVNIKIGKLSKKYLIK